MLKWFSNDESSQAPGAPAPMEVSGSQSLAEVAERLAQTEQLATQLKELIREKDAALCAKDEQLKAGKDACEAKLSKMRLQNRAKVTSLNAQLEELKKQLPSSAGEAKSESRKAGGDAEQEHSSASRGKILLLKKKVEELEQQLSQREVELRAKTSELEAQWRRGEEMDAMLAERDRKLAEREAYIVDLQVATAGDGGAGTQVLHKPAEEQKTQPTNEESSLQELQMLMQNLTNKVEDGEEKYSLLQEQTESLKELLVKEKERFEEKENMYKQNIQTFKDIILQKDNRLTEINQKHEQELFRLAAKSDASADLEQLLKALKQKLHEKEEVLLGKTQVIDVLQGEVDGRDQQIKELLEKARRLQGEKDNAESKLDAEKHVMRAQLRDLMQKQEAELRQAAERHRAELAEMEREAEELRRSPPAPREGEGEGEREEPLQAPRPPTDMATELKMAELEGQVQLKAEEASRSEAKFLKIKAWSKTRIKQLEDELRKAQSGKISPDVNALRSQIAELEEEREGMLCKVEQFDELKTKNEQLVAKLVLYEEQQRKMQADLEQVAKRAASQTSESGSADELQSQVLEWQEIVADAESARDQAREEKAALALRMSHIEEEREALASRQQELEEELEQARGLRQPRGKKPEESAPRSLQEDFEFARKQAFQDSKSTLESSASTDGENMGGLGLRSLVTELELERNQLQEQILGLEERCGDLEDRLQLQARIESLQNEAERLQAQLAGLRSQQTRDAEKHQVLVGSLNEQLKGLSETQEHLESSLIEKEHALAQTSEKLELMDGLRDSLKEKEVQHREVSEKLLQSEHSLTEVTQKCGSFEKQCSELKTSVSELTQKLSALKEKTHKQQALIHSLQSDLGQTNDELDKLNSTHLEERAQLIHNLQSCEREIDNLKDILADNEKEISALNSHMSEYAEQVLELKREIKDKEEALVHVETALVRAEQQAQVLKGSQSSDQQGLNAKITDLLEQLKTTERELSDAKEQKELKWKETEDLMKQAQEDSQTIQRLRGEIQKLNVNHHSHLAECESQISSLKGQATASSQKLLESEAILSQLTQSNAAFEKLQGQLQDKEQLYEKELKAFKEERNNLLADADAHNKELQALAKRLEEQAAGKERITEELQGKQETIALLEQKLNVTREEVEGEKLKLTQELKDRDSENERLQSELKGKSENISGLEMRVKTLESTNQQLKTVVKRKAGELKEQKQLVAAINEKAAVTREENVNLHSEISKLTEKHVELCEEITAAKRSLSERTEEMNTMQSQISSFEMRNSQDRKVIDELLKEKEELTVRAEELSRALEQSKNTVQEQSATLMDKDNALQQITAKCTALQNEILQQKECIAGLQSETEALRSECTRWRQSLEGNELTLKSKNQECQNYLDELNESRQTVESLSRQLDVVSGNSRKFETAFCDLKVSFENQTTDNKKLKEENNLRQSEVVRFQSQVQALCEDNQTLRGDIESHERALTEQKLLLEDMRKKADVTLEENGNLKAHATKLDERIQVLQQEVTNKDIAESELLDDKRKAQSKISSYEIQCSENRQAIEGLLKEKEELMKQNYSVSGNLLEKTNECCHLTTLLAENKESIAHLLEQIGFLKSQVDQLHASVAEKEKMVSEQRALHETQRVQHEQLQETLSLLQEQSTALKSGLLEKDGTLQQTTSKCTFLENESLQLKRTVTQLQGELESLKNECTRLSQSLEVEEVSLRNKAQECQNHIDELSKSTESVVLLQGQLRVANEELLKLQSENVNLKARLENHVAEGSKLRDHVAQREDQIVDLRNCIQGLNEENGKIKTDGHNLTVVVSEKLNEIAVLQSELSCKNNNIVSLTEQLAAVCLEKESLELTLQQRTESIKQQEMFIKQLQVKSVEGKDELEQKMETVIELQTRMTGMQKYLQDLEQSFKNKDTELEQLKEKSAREHEDFRTKNDANSEIVDKLQAQLQSMVEKNNQLTTGITGKESDLLQKVKDCERLRTQVAELEGSAVQLRNQVEGLTSESAQVKGMVKEKEQTVFEIQTQCEDLRVQIKAKEEECNGLKAQLAEHQETVSKLEVELSARSSEIVEFREALVKTQEEKQSAFLNLQENYAALQELHEVKMLLSRKNEEMANLNKALSDRNDAVHAAEDAAHALRNEVALLQGQLQQLRASNTRLSQQKEDALSAHEANAASLTVEIERLKSQHLQVASQMDAMTENIEQRELALHAINNQYCAQVKHAEYLVTEVQKLDGQNKKLREEASLAAQNFQQQLALSITEKEHLQQELKKVINVKEELVRNYNSQLQILQEQLSFKSQQEHSSMNEALEMMKTEKEHLQVQVSDKDAEISKLMLEVGKMAQTLQESENEWLSVLDREKRDKTLIIEQLQSTKDVKIQALQHDLDNLHGRFVEITALLVGSEELKEKELTAVDLRQHILTNKNKLEETLLALQKKENENMQLGQTLIERENALRDIELSKKSSDVDFSEFSQTMSSRLVALEEERFSLQAEIKRLNANHKSDIESLKEELNKAAGILQLKQSELFERERGYQEKNQEVCTLQELVKHLQGDIENLRVAGINQAGLLSEITKKGDQISSMEIQLGQQKELIATLSQQMREKDASVTQVMVSASNEMVRHTEEKNQLLSQLESLQNAQSCSVKEIEGITLELVESKAHLSHRQAQIEIKETEKEELVKENDHLKIQHGQVSKEKDLMKKKLQAALVVRKDLLKKIEEYEKQKKEYGENGIEISSLHDKLKEVTTQAENKTEEFQAHISLLKEEIIQKDNEILELSQVISAKEVLVQELQNDMKCLQTRFNERENTLNIAVQSLEEKCELVERLRVGMANKEEAFGHERCEMTQKLEQFKEVLVDQEQSLKAERATSLSANTDTENELMKVKQEKTVLQKKAHAALLARKETMKKLQDNERKHALEISELNENFNKLLEQHSQQTNGIDAIQVKYNEKIKELEDKQQVIASLQDEVNSLRVCIELKEKNIQELILSLSEKESQVQAASQKEADWEELQDRLTNITSEKESKDALLFDLRQRSVELSEKIEWVESELEKALAEKDSKHQEVKAMEQDYLGHQEQLQRSQALVDELQCALKSVENEQRDQFESLDKMNKTLLESNSRMKEELENALSVISQKSLELQTIQNSSTEIQHQFCQERECLKIKLEESQSYWKESQAEVESCKLHMETLQTEKEQCKKVIASLEMRLGESEKLKDELLQKISVMQEDKSNCSLMGIDEIQSKSYTEELVASLKERDCLIKDKEELIASLEQQLQKEIHLREVALEKMKVRVNELQQRSAETQETRKTEEHRDENKSTEQVTRKLQAALISRKEVMKENRYLKDQIQILSSEKEEISQSSSSLKVSFLELNQQKDYLENSVLSLSKEKEKLISEIDQILSDNHNLSAACESLKLTIESITQQKQAFSCQMESLKDSQTVELSEWKSKHAELKEEYESLLQAYENVSNEMDKMRQLLEAARKEKQELLSKALDAESEKESIGKHIHALEEENEKIKEKMKTFSTAKQQKIRELEEENEKIRSDLLEIDEQEKCRVEMLTLQNSELETEIICLKESSEDLKVKLNEIQHENYSLAEQLKTTSFSLQQWHSESKASEHNLQSKLDKALTLNDSLTAQIESQKVEIVSTCERLELIQNEKLNILEQLAQLQKDHEVELNEKDKVLIELETVVNQNLQETVSLTERVRVLEDDKTLMYQELENVQETADKVKKENEQLDTLLLKKSEKIDELTEALGLIQDQNALLLTQVSESKEEKARFAQEMEERQLKLVKEFEEKLKVIQSGNEGSKNIKKELQELLKEKHHEINQLQQDSIKYQELILDLENDLKLSEAERERVEGNLNAVNDKISGFEMGVKRLEAELSSYRNQLSESRKELGSINSEKIRLKEEVEEKDKQAEIKAMEHERALERVAEQHMVLYKGKLAEFQNQINELQGLKVSNSEVVIDLKRQLDSKDLQMKTLQRESETNSAKLSAVSNSLQGDDLAKHWDDTFQKTLQEKDDQLLEQGYVIKRLLEDARVKDKLVNELQIAKSRQDRALNECTVGATAQQRQLFVMGVRNTELIQNADLQNRQIMKQSAQIEKLEFDNCSLTTQLTDKSDFASQMQSSFAQVERKLLDTESQLLLLLTQNDKLQDDLEKQKVISVQLKLLVQNKDTEISLLLSSKDGQISEYLEQLQKHHRAQIGTYEERLHALYNDKEMADKTFRGLEAKVRALQGKIERSVEEKEQMARKMATFKTSMTSLQAERERLLTECRALEAQRQSAVREEGSLAKEEQGPSQGLKGEIRALLHQMDDLNSENAMLKAQLIRYREDLNQVLSLKDNQLKELLKKREDSIKTLENQKVAMERQCRQLQLDHQKDVEDNNTLTCHNSELGTQVQELEARLLAMSKEKSETNEGKVIGNLQQAVATKAAECNDLQQKLFAQKKAADDLSEELRELRSETERKLGEAEDKYNSELNAFEREVDLMRKEKESADERVTELVGELTQTEKLLSSARTEGKDLKSQHESLGKAMAALQDDRDQLIEDFKVLRHRYDEELRESKSAARSLEHQLGEANSVLGGLDKDRYILTQTLSALRGADVHAQLLQQTDGLRRDLWEKNAELRSLSLENDTCRKQLTAFSKSMASLQNDRDRLIQELAGAKRVCDARQGESPAEVAPGKSGDLSSFRGNFQDRPLGDTGKLRSENVELTQKKHEMNSDEYEAELAALRAEKDQLQAECRVLRERQRLAEGGQSSDALLKQAAGPQAMQPAKESVALLGKAPPPEQTSLLLAEHAQLQRDLQRCLQEIQRRDLHSQQLNAKLQQTAEEKEKVSSQLKAISQTLRDTQLTLGQLQNRCYWLEAQVQSRHSQDQAKGPVAVEVPPGAPQEMSTVLVDMEGPDLRELQSRLAEAEQQLDSSHQEVTQLTESLAEERARREAAEEVLRSAEERVSVDTGMSNPREFSIHLESDDEVTALIIDPNEHVFTRKVKGGVHSLRRWLHGRSLYCSKLLTSRAKSRYLFLAYLLALHVLVFMCMSGAL